MPVESVQQVVELVPQRCQQCQRKLKGKDTHPLRHQVVEPEPVKTVVTEYRSHRLECAACGGLPEPKCLTRRAARSGSGWRRA